MVERSYKECDFTASDPYFILIHQQLDHSMFHAGPKRELLKQLLSKLLASKKDTLEIKIPRSRILAAGSQPEKSETCGFIPPDVKVSFLMV